MSKAWKFDKSGDYYTDLGRRESSGEHSRENEKKYIGLYQMGEAALVDAGYYNPKPLKPGQKPGSQYNNDWSGTWTKKAKDYGINSKEQFLNNRKVQEIAVREYHKRVWEEKGYLKDYQKYVGQEIGGVKLTQAGMVAAAHLVGAGGVINFIKTNGATVDKDANGTTCVEYLKGFSDEQYKVDYSITQPMEALKQAHPEIQTANITVNPSTTIQVQQQAQAAQEEARKAEKAKKAAEAAQSAS